MNVFLIGYYHLVDEIWRQCDDLLVYIYKKVALSRQNYKKLGQICDIYRNIYSDFALSRQNIQWKSEVIFMIFDEV